MIKIERLNKPRSIIKPTYKLAIIGLTPGKKQHEKINSSNNPRHGAFAGSMRSNLFRYFNELGINDYFNITNMDQMFNQAQFLDTVYITSLLRDPVYIIKNGKEANYSGHSPLPWNSDLLVEEFCKTIDILKQLPKNCLIVPLGNIVSEVLMVEMLESELYENILFGFPHPSGANSHQFQIFDENKKFFRYKISQVYGLD